MDIIPVDGSNIDTEHICCAIGNDKVNAARAASKKAWLKDRFADGLVFRRLDARGKVFIEYLPLDKAWKPVAGGNYLLINCLWVSGQYKGQGWSTKLLDACAADARAAKVDGIAVVTGDKARPFMTDKRFYEKNGFVSVDAAPPYFELLVRKLKPGAKVPAFTGNARLGTCVFKQGLAFIYSNQCPFMEEYVALLAGVAKRKGIPFQVTRLASGAEAKEIGSPFGTLGIYWQGKFKAHELMTEAKFEVALDGWVKG